MRLAEETPSSPNPLRAFVGEDATSAPTRPSDIARADPSASTLCVHYRFEQQAARDPAATALEWRGESMCYAELNARANRVARYLVRRGVAPGALVGVCLERSFDLVVALLGVWKAGAAYVPFDPVYPRERLAFMAADAGIGILLADAASRTLFDSLGPNAVDIAREPSIENESERNLAPRAVPDDLAYVMYTSGSTGTPKGAMIRHSGLAHYVAWAGIAYGVRPGDSVPVHSSIAFDLTVTSLYPALVCGASIELLPEAPAAQGLVAALRRRGGRALVKITPAHLELLARQVSPGEAAGLTRCFVIGGENLPAESLRFWREHAPATRLVNEYGPTETVVGCCVHEVGAEDPSQGPVPIGRPIARTQLHVLDADGKPVAPGETGELYIGGAGVGAGYLNRPELTRERFVPDVLSAAADASRGDDPRSRAVVDTRTRGAGGGRLYRTGDLARWRADGVLEYLGRTDSQVKIRGHRIELGEIESTLAGHASVQSCAVLAIEEDGDRRLVAFVVPDAGGAPALEAIRRHVLRWLPDVMAPTRLVVIDALPLTPNGKVDREALARLAAKGSSKPDPMSPAEGDIPSAAATEGAARPSVATRLAAIWRELLQVESIRDEDDIFDLGAHSLMAMKAVARIREAFAVDLQLGDVFEHSTIGGQAAAIERMQGMAAPAATGDREEIAI